MSAQRSAAERLWLLGGAVAVGLTAVVGWFLVVRPELSKASDTRAATSLAQTSNLVLQRHVGDLRSQANQISALTGDLNAARAALPPTSSIDQFTRELSAYAQSNHVRLTSITVSGPKPTGATGSAGAPAPAPSPGATAAAAAGQAVVGHTYSIGVSVVSSGTVADEQHFLRSVQHGSRAVLVTSGALAPPDQSAGHSTVGMATLTIELQVFVEPQSPQDLAELQKLLDSAASN